MGGKEDAIGRGGQAGAIALVKPLDGVHLAVPERVFDLVIGFGDDHGQIGLAQDGGAENLVATRHLTTGHGGDVALDHIEKARGKREILDVYKAAEMIRLEHISDNVALEDIIEKIVLTAGSTLPMEFRRARSQPRQTGDAAIDSPVEFLLPDQALAAV